MLKLLQNDAWLQPYAEAIGGRHQHASERKRTLAGKGTFSEFANGYLYFGLTCDGFSWTIREWAPNATSIYLVGDFNSWREEDIFQLMPKAEGVWELSLPLSMLHHGQHYKLKIYWNGGYGERIPSYATRVVQDSCTKIFSAQVWHPDKAYQWRCTSFTPSTSPLLIYECHVGMAQESEKVGTYSEFTSNVLPRIKAAGYNCIQLMAIQEHPYYGSFGYHVSNFFAPSSRFGTPEELKELIDTAHLMGIAVIMDIVHSHSVKNESEGLGNFAGDPCQYFLAGDRREHPAWDSLCFNYGSHHVLHFLLSNCKYWLDEFHFDGFRFDGVTSMLYYNHGLGQDFMSYADYYDGHEDDEAICYLTLANSLIHEVNSQAICIAEEVSGMPGIAIPFDDGGYGFDYRLAMNIPDYWIKTIKERIDEDWKPSSLFWELTNRRVEEKTISYAESHDQALVGDKTLIFRLVDADMYWHFQKGDENYNVHRGIALHKMIRLLTATTMNGGYLNFMGNEFGHPEWIDFPRQGNGWSHQYARRQWSLVDNDKLCYRELGDFDRDMLQAIKAIPAFQKTSIYELWHDDTDQVLAYSRGYYIFVFNFNPVRSFVDYRIPTTPGIYRIILDTDDPRYGGNGLNDTTVSHCTIADDACPAGKEWLRLYVPARTACILKIKTDETTK